MSAVVEASSVATGTPSVLRMDSFALSPKGHEAKTKTDVWMRRIGLPLGPAAFFFIASLPTSAGLTVAGQRSAAAFAMALIWWVTEPVPTYVTSLVLMIVLVVSRASDPASVMGVFGLDVIWLNILAFILSAMLVKTDLAKRLALRLMLLFGRKASWALGGFVILQLVLAPLIPATAARAAMTLPLMLAVASIYGSTSEHPTNFGRNLFLLNLAGISILSSTVMTGSAANVMAVGFIQSMGGHKVYYTDWLFASAPVAILTLVGAWLLSPRAIFPLASEEKLPKVAGGMNTLVAEQKTMGRLSGREWRAIGIFSLVIFLCATDRYQKQWFGIELGPSISAMIGAAIALTPRIGLLEWNDTDIPWHLMIFSAGAYAGGLTLESTGAAAWGVKRIFGGMDLASFSFGWTYAIIIAVMLYSHLLSTSKTVRTVIMIPAIILMAQGLGWNPASLALPAAFTIDWVIGLPISGKPNVILFGTNQYSARDNLKFGLAVCTLGYLLMLLAGATWFHWLGLTPAFTAHAG
jgi:sodium-dependent dicarboxylate transporter 2/3/5